MIEKLWQSVGLRARILLALELVAVPFLIFVFYTAYQQESAEQQAYEQRSLGLARLIAARLDDKIGDLESLTAAFSVAAVVDQAHTADNDAFLARMRKDAPEFANNIAVWDLSGANVGSLDPRTHQNNVNVMDRKFFRDALTSNDWVVEGPIVSRSSGDYIAQFARAVMGPGGVPVGVVTASAALAGLQNVIEPQGALPEGAVLTIISSDGVILARSVDPDKWVGKHVPDVAAFQTIRAEPAGVSIRKAVDGVERVLAHSNVTHVPWTLYVGVPVSTIAAPVRANALRFIAFGAGLVILASALAFAIARTVVTPLTLLAGATRRFGDGDLSHRARVGGPPEIRKLAQTFNKVAADLQERTEKLIHLSEVDQLTGLPNRRRFEDGLREAVIECVTTKRQAALFFIDVDYFKSINDTLGHDEGDRALCAIASRLKEVIHSDDLVARLGGDEFVVLLRVPSEAEANVVCHHIKAAMEEPVALASGPLMVSLSIGIAMYAGYPMSPSDFLKSADQALYAAKQARTEEMVV